MPDGLISKKMEFKDLPLVRGGETALFFVSFGIFILAAALSGGLFLYNRVFNEQIKVAEEDLESRRSEFSDTTVNQLISLDKRLSSIRILISQHIFPSNVLALIEKTTHPRVSFSAFLYSADSRKIDLRGEAASYSILARQIGLFESSPNIDRVEFGGLSLGERGLVNFKMSIIFKPEFLRLSPVQ